jgi:nicotinamide-nucleotide amidase
LTRPRAVVVATGSELVRGDRTDLNGPFLARELLRLGFEPAQIVVVGDRPDELERALANGIDADFCAISGGLGPTHDDRTVELLAKVAGRPLHVDEALVREIGAVSRPIAERYGRPYADFEPGVRKQATLPEGAVSLGLAGTAPGIVLGLGMRVAVALPGPPPELERLWPRALETDAVRAVLARATPPRHDVLRLFGVGESVVARALDAVGGDGDGVDATICARDMEIHVDLFAEPGAGARADGLAGRLTEALEPYVFATDERPVEAIVLSLLRERGLTLATAESCTGGLVAERLTSVAGASDVFRGAIVAYADGVKRTQLRVDENVLARHGAVSAAVAAAMAEGALVALGADVAVAVTGVAGPGGGTPEKPVGLVHLHAVAPGGGEGAELRLHGDRETIRRRATVAALHLLRTVAAQNRHRDV